jgi:hypothetical protein
MESLVKIHLFIVVERRRCTCGSKTLRIFRLVSFLLVESFARLSRLMMLPLRLLIIEAYAVVDDDHHPSIAQNS